MAIKIAISLTALSLIQIGMAEVWDRKGSAPIVGQDRQAHYLLSLTTAALPPDGSGVAWWLAWCGGRWLSSTKERSMKPKPSLFSHILQHPQAIDAHPIPNSLSWYGKTLGMLGLEA